MNKFYCVILAVMMCSPIWAAEGKVITSCSVSEMPPIVWQNKNALVGVAPEIVSIIYRDIGYQVKTLTWPNKQRCLDLLREGNVDIVYGLYEQPESDFIQLVYPAVFYEKVSVFVLHGYDFKYTQWDDLIGKTGVTLYNDQFGYNFQKFADKHIVVKKVSTRVESFDLLANRHADFIPLGYYSGLLQAKLMGYGTKIKALKTPIYIEPVYIGISKNSPHFNTLAHLTKELGQLHEMGVIQELTKIYVDQYLLSPSN